MDALTVTKFVVRNAVALGVTKIARDIIANNTNTPDRVIDKITMVAGAAAIGMAVDDLSRNYVNNKIDATVIAWREMKQKLKEAQNETTVSDSDPA